MIVKQLRAGLLLNVFALLSLILLVLLASMPGDMHAEERQPATTSALSVQTAPVQLVTNSSGVRVPGTVEAVERSTISARISATVVAVAVKLGDAVETGQTLVRLQAAELNARAAQERAKLDQVRRNLARENRLLAQQAATAESVRSLRDAERVALAAVQEAEAMLAYTTIKAPYAGVISRKMVNSGDLAAPGMALLELENPSALQVRAQAPEETAGRLELDSMVTVVLPASGAQMQARLKEIAPAANPAARSATIVLALADTADKLRSGQYVQVLLPGAGSSQMLSVPAATISSWGQKDRVFVLEGDQARLRLVRTGARLGENIEVLAGLDVGEQVILSPAAQLKDGQTVQVRP